MKKYALWFTILTAVYFCASGLFYWLVHDDWYRAVLEVESVLRGSTTAELKEGMTLRQTMTVPADYLMDMTLEFNRWGEEIFSTTDVNVGWDGYLDGKICPTGAYVYKSSGKFSDGRNFTRNGEVYLIQ